MICLACTPMPLDPVIRRPLGKGRDNWRKQMEKTREQFEKDANNWIQWLDHLREKAAKEVARWDILTNSGSGDPSDYIKRREPSEQRMREYERNIETARSVRDRILSEWRAD